MYSKNCSSCKNNTSCKDKKDMLDLIQLEKEHIFLMIICLNYKDELYPNLIF